jgi:hypothetical protein
MRGRTVAAGTQDAKARRMRKPSSEIVAGHRYRVLSLHGPWAWSILFAGKDVECRTWETPFRGRFLVHASSKRFGRDMVTAMRVAIATTSRRALERIPDVFPTGQLLGSVELVDIVDTHRSRWSEPDRRIWVLRDPQPFPEPVSDVRGARLLWEWTAPRR